MFKIPIECILRVSNFLTALCNLRSKTNSKSVLILSLYLVFAMSGFEAMGTSGTPEIETQLGFRLLSDKSTPAYLRSAAQSVFEVRVPSISPESFRVMDLESEEFRDFQKIINSLPEEKFSKQERVVVEKQIEYCRRQNNSHACDIMLHIEKGTSFLAGGDGSYLLTNAHVVDRYLTSMAKAEGKSVPEYLERPQWVPIFIFDSSGNLVLDPYLNYPALVKFGTPSLMTLLLGSFGRWYSEDSDYVVLKLPKVLGKPLKIAKSFEPGDNLYHLGFPACTGCDANPNKTDPEENRDRKHFGNSNGKDLYWNPPGKSYSVEQASQILKTPPDFFERSNLKSWIFFSSDGQVGMSGGPIINEKGEVVGVYAGSKPLRKADGSLSILGRGVRPPEFNQ